MLTKYIFITLIGVNCVFACFELNPYGYSNDKDLQNDCLNEKKLDAEMLPKNNTFWMDPKHDSQCLNQCMMDKLGLLEDGDVDRVKFESYVDRVLNHYNLRQEIVPQCYSETYSPKNDECWSPSKTNILIFQRNENTGKNFTTRQIIEEILPQSKIDLSEVQSVKVFSANIFFIIYHENLDREFISAYNRLKNQKLSLNGSTFSSVDGCTVFSTVIILQPEDYTTEVNFWQLKWNGKTVDESKEDRYISGIKTNEEIFWMDITKPLNATILPHVQIIPKFVKLDNKMMTTTENPNTVSCRNVNTFLRCVAQKGKKICKNRI
jgi:hypothetical protein